MNKLQSYTKKSSLQWLKDAHKSTVTRMLMSPRYLPNYKVDAQEMGQ